VHRPGDIKIGNIGVAVVLYFLADVVNTNQLGSDRDRVLASLEDGDTVGRILVIKNLALAVMLLPLALAVSLVQRSGAPGARGQRSSSDPRRAAGDRPQVSRRRRLSAVGAAIGLRHTARGQQCLAATRVEPAARARVAAAGPLHHPAALLAGRTQV
jgi:hypothetical protein